MRKDAAERAKRLSTPAPTPQGAAPADAPPVGRPRAAIIAVHGMGQQNRFDTMTSLAGRLYDITGDPKTPRPAIKVVNRKMGGDRTQVCCEFVIPTADGRGKEVAVFETYWAPFTEGKIGFWATVWFLFVSGVWGTILTGKDFVDLHGFQRWVFERIRNYGISRWTFLQLVVAFFGVFGITVTMVAALAALATRLAAIAAHSLFSASLTASQLSLVLEIDTLQTQFASVLLALLSLGAAIAVVLGGAGRLASSPLFTKTARWLLLELLVVVAVTAGLCGVALLAVSAQAASNFVLQHGSGYGAWVDAPRDLLRTMSSYVPGWLRWRPMVVIPLNLGLFWIVYFFGKQFVGDVAIYVSAHRVNRYWDTREGIRGVAHDVAKDVYGCKEGDTFLYDEVYFVAHSLGSNVAYDTLNAIFRDELVLQRPIDAVARTKGFLTYGSPLDKTAFLFRAYSSGSVERLAAVAAWQPLITSTAFRKFPWINIYSAADPISASIEYYGPPGEPFVDNRHDEQSLLPFVAHVQYEKHQAFRVALRELIGAK